MGYTDMSFLDTKQEHDRWHHGLYKGLQTYRPDTLAEKLKVRENGWRDWYHNDQHYHDFAMIGAYTLKMLGISIGLRSLAALGL